MGRFVPKFGPHRTQPQSEILYDGPSGFVHRTSGIVECNAASMWNRSVAQIARKFKITGLEIRSPGGRAGLAFLEELPTLRQLRISLPTDVKPLDWRPLERLTHLEDLSINSSRANKRPSSPGEPDFTAVKRLVTCSLSPWESEWASVLRCSNLRGLYVAESVWERSGIKDLDLHALDRLTELQVDFMARLVVIHRGMRSRLKSLVLRRCQKLRIDWPRFGRDLEYLWIEKKPAYAYDELRAALKLKGLMLSNAYRIPSAEFLRHLPHLEWLNLFLADFTEAGCQVIRSLKHLRVAGMKMPRSSRRPQGMFAASGWRQG